MTSGTQPQSMSSAQAALHSSLSSEWYTPPEILDVVRGTLSMIALDPASTAFANQLVGATRYFTPTTDGLSCAWADNWFCNPPYSGAGGAAVWVRKMDEQYRQHGHRGVALLNATTDRSWFVPLWRYSICFLYRRIRFLEEPRQYLRRALSKYKHCNISEFAAAQAAVWARMGSLERVGPFIRGPQPTHGNVLVYFGDDPATFVTAVGDLGHVVIPDHLRRS